MKLDNQLIQTIKTLIDSVPENERGHLEKLLNEQFLLVHISFKVVGHKYHHKNILLVKRSPHQESPSDEDFKRFYQVICQKFNVTEREVVILAERPLYMTVETFLNEIEEK